MLAHAVNLSISPEAYAYLAELVYAQSRIRLGPDKQALVTGRLAKRLRALQLDSFEAYCELLKSAAGHDELGPLVDLISTNHTNFFREIEHLNSLRELILPFWCRRLSACQPFRIWSAACSSGEEPYTIAIVLAEYARDHGDFPWVVEASDISSRILERAKNAIYDSDRVKLPQADWLPRYFQKGTADYDGFYRVKETLRRRVTFHRLNLLQASYPVAPQQHVIFCRNVMIYFDTPTQQELVSKLFHQLAEGGYLIVGHSENLLGIKHTLRGIRPGIYQKGPTGGGEHSC